MEKSGKGNEVEKANIAHRFNNYREENEKILMWLKRFKNIFNKIDYSVSDKDVLNKKSKLVGDTYNEIFRTLGKDVHEVEALCDELSESIEGETSAIKEFMSRQTFDDVTTTHFLLKKINNYNGVKYHAVKKLVMYVPSLDKNLDGLANVPEIRVAKSAELFRKALNGLRGLVFSKNVSKGNMFTSLGRTLEFLFGFNEDIISSYSDHQQDFVNKLGSKDAGKFAKRYFSGGYGRDQTSELRKLLSKYEINLEGSGDNTYNSLTEDEDREKIDKFTKDTLLFLFENTSYSEDVIKNVKKIYSDDDDSDSSSSGKKLTDEKKREYILKIIENYGIIDGIVQELINIEGDKAMSIDQKNNLKNALNYFKFAQTDKKLVKFLESIIKNIFKITNYDPNTLDTFKSGLISLINKLEADSDIIIGNITGDMINIRVFFILLSKSSIWTNNGGPKIE